MPLILAVLATGLSIELLGTIISVAGVSAMTGGNLIIIAFVIALDIGKVFSISILYSFWDRLHKALRAAAFLFAGVTIAISTVSAGGYLSGELKKSLMPAVASSQRVVALESQIAKYELRKKQIDDQIANLPEKTSVNNRLRMIRAFNEEQKSLDGKITAIEEQMPDLKDTNAAQSSEAGPILALATALNITFEQAINVVVGLLCLVFNPFAVFLVVVANFLIKQAHTENEVVSVITPTVETPSDIPVLIQPLPTIFEPAEVPTQTLYQEPVPLFVEPEIEEVIPEAVVETVEDDTEIKGVRMPSDISVESETPLTKQEQTKRTRHVSALLDKSLDKVRDEVVNGSQLKSVENLRMR